MRRHALGVAVCVALAMLAAVVTAQRAANAELLFQEATHAELVEGDLDKAIRLYRDLLNRFPNDRVVAAQALVKLGACYQKLGRDEARGAYERVLRDYADQPDAVRIARAKLQDLGGTTPASGSAKATGPTYRLVLDGFGGVREEVAHFPRPFDFAPDGSRFVFRRRVPEKKTALLFVADADGALVRPLLADTGTWSGFQYPRWSPDGRRVAYLVHKAPSDVPGTWGIFVADAETGKTSQIGADFPESPAPGDLAWTPDGREMTYVIPSAEGRPDAAREGIYSRSIASGETRPVQAMPVHWSLRLGGYSPDGRWLAFHHMAGDGNQRDIDVWLLPARGGRALKVTEGKGIEAQPTWAPDGRALYFISDRSGDLNVWKVGVDPTTGVATAGAQQVTFFTDGRVMHPRLFAGGRLAITLSRDRTVIKAGHPSRPGEARAITRGRAPQLSPDGRTVYYMGEGPDQRGLFAIAISGGAPVRLAAVPLADSGFDLSPDGRTFAYFTKDGNQVQLYTLSAAGGAPRLLVKWAATGETAPISPPRWSPDGSQIAYAQDQTLFTLPAAGGQPRKIAQLYQWQEWLWAPDGQSIGALAYAAPHDIAVFVVAAVGGEPRRLTEAVERQYKEGLSWHPDGRRLAYMIYLDPGGRDSALREAFVDGRPTSTLVREPDEWEYVGRWSPDGRQFLYLAMSGGKSPLYAFDPATATSRLYAEDVQIGVSGLGHGLMSWSTDGSVVAWATISISSQLWIAEHFR